MSATMILGGLGWSQADLSDSVVSHLGVKCVRDCRQTDLDQLGILWHSVRGKASGAQSTVSFFAAFKEAKQMENEKRHAGESLICFALEFSLAGRGK